MEYKNIEFSTNYMNILHSDDDVVIVRLRLMHTGENRNKCDISTDSVLASINTFYNKPIIYDLNNKYTPKLSTDVSDHNKSKIDSTMNIAGSIIESGGYELINEDGKEYLYMVGVIHKIYQPLLTKIINDRKGELKVSIELLPLKAFQREDGVLVIEEFKLLSVCLLGRNVMEGIEGSKMQVLKYSSEEYNNKYIVFSQEFSKFKMGTKPAIKIDKSKESLSETSWGDVDKSTLMKNILEAKNYKTLIKSVYLLVEDGWEDAPSEHLKYPVMEIKQGKLVYNKYALASALGYAKKNNETTVVSKAEILYKKLELEEEVESVENEVKDDVKKEEEEVVQNSETETFEENADETKPSEVKKEDDDNDDDEEDVEDEKVENSTEEEMISKNAYTELEMKCNSLEKELQTYKRKEEMQKMFELIDKFSHCYSEEEKEAFAKEVEACNYSEMEAKIDNKVKEFALGQKKNEEKPQAFSQGFGISIVKPVEETKGFDIKEYVKKMKQSK